MLMYLLRSWLIELGSRSQLVILYLGSLRLCLAIYVEEMSSGLYMVLYVAAYVGSFYVLRVLVKLKDGTGVEASFIFKDSGGDQRSCTDRAC